MKALLWMSEEQSRCSGCGTAEWERDRYVAELDRCELCEKAAAEAQFINPHDTDGIRVVFVRRPDG